MGASNCATPLMLLPALLLFLLCFSTFNSYYVPRYQVNGTTKVYTAPSLNISTTSTSNSTQGDGFFDAFSLFSSSNSNTSTSNTISEVPNTTNLPCIREKSSLEKIENGLARARRAIREAVRRRNYTSHKEEDFIPSGSIYRNPYAFHQSHIEMEKRFRVWVYKEGEPPLVHDGPVNNIYSTEGQFMDEMESGKNPLMAKNPDEAHVFYLPFSVHNVLRYVIKPEKTFKRDLLQLVVEDYVRVIANKYPYWNRSSGADHFMVSCHDWVGDHVLGVLSQGPDIVDAHPKLFQYFIRVLCNANTSEGFHPRRDVSLPEINLPFGRLAVPNHAQSQSKRLILAFFAGRSHGNIRKILFKHWKEKDNEVQVYEHLPKGLIYTKLMGQSKYCLCPSGWEVASPRVVEAINGGCVPVLISDDYVLPFSDVLDWSQFSVQIPVEKIQEIKIILEAIPNVKFLRMQKRLRIVQKHFEINRPAKRFDITHMVLHSVWLRRLNLQLPL